MKAQKLTAAANIAANTVIFLSGWLIVILFELTGADCKFCNMTAPLAFAAVGAANIIISMACAAVFFGKDRAKRRRLFAFDVIMTLFPYAYLAAVDFYPTVDFL
ncbi:MAG: hypothetical protein IJJ76_12340 [Ruminococcus sp.]|uniref:hypothetical protein n=1 Tax=Ruminococcus sp. TaxID=41978 RepID=UPI0025F55DB7|nr:hypothetical protein [Ruminococcus sp.]MBR0530535.1 hypothetical protein [Ruminococcus sp.]